MRQSGKRPAIGFLSSGGIGGSGASWPGTQGFMMQAMNRNCGDVTDIGPIEFRMEVLGKLFDRGSRKLLGKGYAHRHSVLLSRMLGKAVEKRIKGKGFDYIFVAATSSEGAFIPSHPPIVYASDATFARLAGYYPNYSNLLRTSVRDGYAIENNILRESSLSVYPSEWARESAVRDHGADPSKLRIIPFGANLPPEEVPPWDTMVAKRESNSCKLLFMGVDWERKGWRIACDALTELRRQGVDAELLACGCQPPAERMVPGVRVVPRIYKWEKNGMSEFRELMMMVDFMLLPTRQECYGMVFCEASAFGVPSISTDTGGVSGAIRNGKNGYMLSLDAEGAEYAQIIGEIFRDKQRLQELRASSRMEFDSRLNWDSWARSLNQEIMGVL